MSGKTRITFEVFGNTAESLRKSAEIEIERFFDMENGIPPTFPFFVEATKPLGSSTYRGVVTAER
jgi:hypothetical protein